MHGDKGGVPWPLCVPDGQGGRRVGGGARHLDRGTSRLQEPRRGGPLVPPPLFLKVLIPSMCERRPEGRELRGLSCRGGVGTNCIERCVLPNEVRKEKGPEDRDGGWTQDPPRGPKVPVWHVCPQQGQHWAAPTSLFCPPRSLSTSSLLSLANTVGGDGQRSPRLALVAGSRGLGRGGLAGWPILSILPICWCWAQGLPGLWVRAGPSVQKGCRQPSINSRCQRPTASICRHLVWEGFGFFSCLSFVLFSSCLFHRAGSPQGASYSI